MHLTKRQTALLVIGFTVLAQWAIVEFGGDFTQTMPLTFAEWRSTVGLGAMSLPIGFIMRLIPVEEDPDSFAVMGEGKSSTKKDNSWLRALVIALLPFLMAIIYQLYWEVEELKH